MVSSAVMHEVQPDLIYDLGMHTGLDTKYYLDKGFRVVAVEANPKLVERGHAQFADAIAAGKLHIVDRALWSGDETEVSVLHQ
jgi:predicted RNA methylase